MFEKKSAADELANFMQRKLIANAVDESFSIDKLEKAVDYLNSAADLFEDAGMHAEAEAVTKVIEKLANVPTDTSLAEEAPPAALDVDDQDLEKVEQMLDFEDE